jgi:hypothetical protein
MQFSSYVWQVRQLASPNFASSAWPPSRNTLSGVCERGGIEWHAAQYSGA